MSVELTQIQLKILRIVKAHQPMAYFDLLRATGFSASVLGWQLVRLKRLGLIHRDGSIWLTVAGSEVIDET